MLGTSAVAAPTTDRELVESAIAAAVGTSSPGDIQQRKSQSRARLAEVMRLNPQQPTGGVVVFAAGKDAKEIEEFVGSHQLQIFRAEAKVAVSASNATYTMSFGAYDLYFLDGPLTERLEKIVGRQRAMFLAAAGGPDAANRTGLREAAYSQEILFYKIEAVGSAAAFEKAQTSPEVAAVLLDAASGRAESLAQAISEARQRRFGYGPVVQGRPYADGPPLGLRGIPDSTPIIGGPPVRPPDAGSRLSPRSQESAQ